MREIRCIECYKERPGGRCQWCPLRKENQGKYTPVGNGYFLPKKEENKKKKE